MPSAKLMLTVVRACYPFSVGSLNMSAHISAVVANVDANVDAVVALTLRQAPFFFSFF